MLKYKTIANVAQIVVHILTSTIVVFDFQFLVSDDLESEIKFWCVCSLVIVDEHQMRVR